MRLFQTLLLFIFFVSVHQKVQAQTQYIVKFKNKAFQTATLSNPAGYLSPRSIARRQRYNIQVDSTDLPVTPRYLDSLRNIPTVTVLTASRWLNQVSIQTTDAAALAKINSFSFVQALNPIAARTHDRIAEPEPKWGTETGKPVTKLANLSSYYEYGLSTPQVNIHNGNFLHDIGLRGQGMFIGMLDAGYYQYTSLKAFDSVNANRQVLDTYDFVRRETSVSEDHSHGMNCFSIIAANIPGQFIGTAPKANFFLYRSEDAATEYPIEEHNWVCAAERVDSSGGDVISSSLGYTTFSNPAFNHTYADMNGNTTMAAIGADLAARKGILVFNAAGNEGTSGWKYISTPADADSILAVGSVNSAGVPAAGSSYGPSSDGQVKPDVASLGVGTVIQASNNTITYGSGTSYACPNLAGLATCLWQGFPEFNNIFIADIIRRSGSTYATPNDRIGYGIPDMKKAVLLLLKAFATTSVQLNGCTPTIIWKSKSMAGMKYEIERKTAGENNFIKLGELPATGSTFSTQTFQYQDLNPFIQSGMVSYRIRQIIDTAAATFTADYLDTTNISIGGLCTINQITLAPNPATDQIVIQITIPDAMPDMEIRVNNTLGQTVRRTKYNKPSGVTAIPVFITDLPSGKYFVTIYNNKKKLSTKEFIKLLH